MNIRKQEILVTTALCWSGVGGWRKARDTTSAPLPSLATKIKHENILHTYVRIYCL